MGGWEAGVYLEGCIKSYKNINDTSFKILKTNKKILKTFFTSSLMCSWLNSFTMTLYGKHSEKSIKVDICRKYGRFLENYFWMKNVLGFFFFFLQGRMKLFKLTLQNVTA